MYKEIAVINEAHKIYLVQDLETKQLFVKKVLDVYNVEVYDALYINRIKGIPQIIDYYDINKQLILIEEYISGVALSEKIKRHELSSEDIISYMSDLCETVSKLHSLTPPIIHRDIKPSNIIITGYGKAILLDFNAAKQYTVNEAKDTRLLGTDGYAAPEQYGFGSSTPKTDIYALGIVLKEMVDSLSEPTDKFKGIIAKCTMMNPKERYETILDLQEELHSLTGASKKHQTKHKFLRFLPPGFRTLTPWKMIVASFVYFMIFFFCLNAKVDDTTGFELWVTRIFCLTTMLSIVCIGCNYLNVYKLMPLCKHQKLIVRLLGIFLLILMAVTFWLIVLVAVASIYVVSTI